MNKPFVIYAFILCSIVNICHAKNFQPLLEFEVSKLRSVTQGIPNHNCSQFQTNGFPVATDKTIVNRSYYTCRSGYATQYDPVEKSPVWTAEHLTAATLKGNASRSELSFVQDPDIPRRSVANDYDFSRSGFQRGHLAPAGNFKNDQLAMNESFFYTNAVPQAPRHNMHIWNYLEAATREIATRRGELFVITGPVYTSNPRKKIGANVSVPDALYKVLIDPRTNEMTAFLIPNSDDVGDDFNKFQMSVRNLEKLAAINFNPELNRKLSDKSEVSGGDWVMPRSRKRNRDS
ncbi:MAG: DNA/RNA non-specific endonuclease [Gammaproteobacteria bacterium]|nr:MAG: DNA/RNA non-specific endonuclease [Gammaproteobacteria bacterium]